MNDPPKDSIEEKQPQRFRNKQWSVDLAFSGAVKKTAYKFDGNGNFSGKEWDLELRESEVFSWFHVELPRSTQRLTLGAQCLIELLCPPLKLREILALVGNGPFCSSIEEALVFRINSAGPTTSRFTHRIAALVTDDRVISVSLGPIPGLELLSGSSTGSILNEVPRLDSDLKTTCSAPASLNSPGIIIEEHALELLLTMNCSAQSDKSVPRSVSNLLVRIIRAHVDQLQDIATKLEVDLDGVEREHYTGGYVVNDVTLDVRRFPNMHLDLQRLLQVIAHGEEEVFPRLKELCTGKKWCTPGDLVELDVLVGRLHRLKDKLGFISCRITAIQAGLDTWQAEEINRKLYHLSFLSVIFLPMTLVTGAFGMNVGGIPWTEQTDETLQHGFRNVVAICVVLLLGLILCLNAHPLYSSFRSLRKHYAAKKRPHSNSDKSVRIRVDEDNVYLPLWKPPTLWKETSLGSFKVS